MIGVTATHRTTAFPATGGRRLDPLARLALAAAEPLAIDLTPDTALVVGTAYGSVTATQRLLDGMRTDGDQLASPAAFTASTLTHSTGALSEALKLHGPVATISQGPASALAALRWAWCQLAAGRTTAALVVAGDHPTEWCRGVIERLGDGTWQREPSATAWLLRLDAGRELRANGDGPVLTCTELPVRLPEGPVLLRAGPAVAMWLGPQG